MKNSKKGSLNDTISTEEEEDVYEVERIIGRRKRNGKIQYLIKWKNYTHVWDTWEPIENLFCQELLDEFLVEFRRENGPDCMKLTKEILLKRYVDVYRRASRKKIAEETEDETGDEQEEEEVKLGEKAEDGEVGNKEEQNTEGVLEEIVAERGRSEMEELEEDKEDEEEIVEEIVEESGRRKMRAEEVKEDEENMEEIVEEIVEEQGMRKRKVRDVDEDEEEVVVIEEIVEEKGMRSDKVDKMSIIKESYKIPQTKKQSASTFRNGRYKSEGNRKAFSTDASPQALAKPLIYGISRNLLPNMEKLERQIIMSGEPPIKVVNEVDNEDLPEFEYTRTLRYGKGVPRPDPGFLEGCDCKPHCIIGRPCSCRRMNHDRIPYDENGRVIINPGYAIYECNVNCSCGPKCPYRVVQHGIRHPMEIFKTPNIGWGVRTTRALKMGEFIAEYIGEVVTDEEGEKRGRLYDATGQTYLFDLDFFQGERYVNGQEVLPEFTIDAYRCGNVSHFFNHSCDPNLAIYTVLIDSRHFGLHRIAFFTRRPVREYEELTFDYRGNKHPMKPAVRRHQITAPIKSFFFKFFN
ncbi:uncharacterized protein VTP21DRAFT_5162 [Calcarisporiella thermophila]|uniref:uncharacterized protein n=1 Tax=Calcarisporiella thermophila TaxID=911321 RepID=UPI0037425F05